MFINTLGAMRRFAAVMRDLGVTPELEAYDLGHLTMARFLIDEGTLEPPVRIQLVLGILGGAGNSIDELLLLRREAQRILSSDLGSIGVAPPGSRCNSAAQALGWRSEWTAGLGSRTA